MTTLNTPEAWGLVLLLGAACLFVWAVTRGPD